MNCKKRLQIEKLTNGKNRNVFRLDFKKSLLSFIKNNMRKPILHECTVQDRSIQKYDVHQKTYISYND